MTNLADLLPAGGGQNNTDFVADGTISSGAPVVLTAAGKAAPVSGTAGVVGSETQLLPNAQDYPSVCSLSGSQSFAGVNDYNGGAGNTGEGFILTLSGSTVTAQTTPSQYTANQPYYQACCYDSVNDRIVMVWHENAGGTRTLYVRVGTYTGTGASASISWGTAVAVTTSTHTFYFTEVAFDPDTGNFVIFWSSQQTSWYGYAWVGTVTGGSYDTATMGSSSVAVVSAATEYNNLVYDPDTDRMIFTYLSSGFYGKVGTVSGTSTSATVSVGAAAQLGSSLNANSNAPVYDTANNKVVVVISDDLSLDAGVGTVTGGGTNTIEWGDVAVIQANTGGLGASAGVVATYDSNANKVIGAWRQNSSPYYSYMNDITITGTVPSAGTNTVIVPSNSQNKKIAYNSGVSKTVYVGEGSGAPITGSLLFSPTITNLTSTNLLGIASGAISDTATGTINTWGSRNSAQSSLTIGSDYYVQDDGTITTDTGGQLIGKAITATQINIKDYTG